MLSYADNCPYELSFTTFRWNLLDTLCGYVLCVAREKDCWDRPHEIETFPLDVIQDHCSAAMLSSLGSKAGATIDLVRTEHVDILSWA